MALKTHRHSLGSVALQSQLFSTPQHRFLCNQTEIFTHASFSTQVCDSQYDKETARLENFQESDCQNNNDIESSLESLCIQMMEHALGP